MANSETVGSRIRECRRKAKLTQEKLAEKVNISPTYLSEIETDHKQAGRDVICAIAQELDVSLDYLLFTGKESKEDLRLEEWRILFQDCSGYEQKVLYELVRSAKSILRENDCFMGVKK